MHDYWQFEIKSKQRLKIGGKTDGVAINLPTKSAVIRGCLARAECPGRPPQSRAVKSCASANMVVKISKSGYNYLETEARK